MKYIFMSVVLLALVASPVALFVAGYTQWHTSGGYLSPLPVRVHMNPSGWSANTVIEHATGNTIIYIGLPD